MGTSNRVDGPSSARSFGQAIAQSVDMGSIVGADDVKCPPYPFVVPAWSPSFRRRPADMMVDGPTRVIRFTDARSASVSPRRDRSSSSGIPRLVRFFDDGKLTCTYGGPFLHSCIHVRVSFRCDYGNSL